MKASLAGLELGEVICLPTLGDPSLVAAWESTSARFLRGNPGVLADRYLTNKS